MSKKPTQAERNAAWLQADPSRVEVTAKMAEYADHGKMNFFAKMCDSYDQWGTLTEKQEAAVRKIIIAREAELADRVEKAANTTHVGEVGKRHHFPALVVSMVHKREVQYRSHYGKTTNSLQYITAMEDEQGNVIVCKSSIQVGERGDHVDVETFVKEHKTWQGIPQTVINRPKVIRLKAGRAVGNNFLPAQTVTVTRDRRARGVGLEVTAEDCRYYTQFDNS